MALDILKLILVSLIPVACAIVLMLLLVFTKFKNIKKTYQTIVITAVFSITCILGTVLSVKTSTGAAINVRDASPIIAGLIFGGPAGIISGIVGGLYRFVAAYWDPELMTTQIACSVATALSGVFTAFIRKFIFNGQRGKWYYGAFIAVLVEDFHMLMIFITNFNNTEAAYEIVNVAIVPMMISHVFSVCLASIAACIITKEKFFRKPTKLKLTSKIQLSLVGLLLGAYLLVSGFTYLSVYDSASKNATQNLQSSVYDLKNDVDISVDYYMYDKVRNIADEINTVIASSSNIIELDTKLKDKVYTIESTYKLSEVNIVGTDNLVHYSTQGYDNPPFDMADPSNKQANEFVCLNEGVEYFVQEIREPSSKQQERTKYAGHTLNDSRFGIGFVQIGLFEGPYHLLLDDQIKNCATFRHLNKDGFLAVTDYDGKVVSISSKTANITNIDINNLPTSTKDKFFITIDGESRGFYTFQIESEGYHIIAFADSEEVTLPSRISFVCMSLVQIFAFMMLYCILYIVIRHAVTNRIENIGVGLEKITNGDLNVKIDERNSSEMIQLSDNINKTVESLKEYATRELKKNEEELKFAKTIQHSVLPSEFPLDEKFQIYASMDTAKAVGGDFYDFFFVDHNHLAIEIADVSGKGVPAALFMMQAKTIIKNLTETGMSVDEVFIETNKRLCENNEAQMFVTAWLGIIDLTNGRVEFVNAGHNSPIICGENGEYIYLKGIPGFILGGIDNFKYKKQSFDIKPGQMIYLYTDGVTEAMNDKEQVYGEDRLVKLINKNIGVDAHILCQRVLEDVKEHSHGVEQSDDITMLCFGLNGNESSNAIVVDANIENVDKITSYVNKLLDEKGCDKKAKVDIDVAIDELFSNICYYAYEEDKKGKAKIVLDFYDENHVAIIFEDIGKPYNPLLKKDPDSSATLDDRQIGGLGIYIVKNTMDNMEYKNVNGHNILKISKTIK